MADSVVVIENFQAWRRAIKQLDAGLDREVKDAFLQIGDEVAKDASAIARAKMAVNPDGAIYEYGSGGAKAFLAPAVRKNLKFIESEFVRAIEETAIKAGYR
jgi:hypothetical protein